MPGVTEIEALVGVCAEIDRAMRDDLARRERVTRVLAIDDTAGARRPRARPRARPGPGPPGLLSVDEALTHLGGIPARGDMAACRLLAIGGLVHADPAFGRNGAKRALAAQALAGGDLSWADAGFDPLDAMEEAPTNTAVVNVLSRCGLTSDPVATFEKAVPCPGRTLDEVKVVLNPENWLRCDDHWSAMSLVDGADGRPHYRENVSLAGGIEILTVEACLQFVQSEGPGQVPVLDFKRCDVDEHQEGSGVVVDEGWIVAEQAADGVLVTTSKRVQFADETIDGLSLVLTGCHLGYGDLTRGLVMACLACKRAVKHWKPVEVVDGRRT